ncbi:MAG TPA: YHYH protein, partial [Thermoanaerobaculia bacterium]|nr:YHYH protein [Thermoanaerobaculia bacterium]
AALAHDLPLGDGHVTDHPAVGNVYSCRTTFRGGGARHAGSWFHGDTWDPTEKPHVQGRVYWPEAAFTLTLDGSDLLFTGNSLPIKEPTGIFPIKPTDPAYQYDTNPNSIKAQHLELQIPADPVLAAQPSCLPMGMIGFTVSGVAFYSALDDAGRDAAAHEIQDTCDGHPQANSQYHYHNASPCIPGVDSNKVVGWALDGFPILGLKDTTGKYVTDADLDACHGRREKVTVDGRTYNYAYHLTREYPYTLGCFAGKLLPQTRQEVRDGLEPSRRLRRGRRGPGGVRGPWGPPSGE